MIRTIILLATGLTLLYFAIRSLRAMRIKERYALIYLFIGFPFLGLAVWPDAVVWAVDTLKIEKPTVLVLCLTIFSMVMIYKLLSIVSVQDRKITTLSQMVAILMEKQSLIDERIPAQSPLKHQQHHPPT